ncbi:MAG: putative O-glycosylation ligase, exosortase A system-associated [Chromatiaceae bacterium]|nr:putative O-glycosylation ligase, exosortase A system-associated [Gammaproteobacteria bacterium]MCP5422985.1 putative O-glycosylation ligase, exosortase A system-associated [Chromatiaceae bacterium]
MRDIIVTAIVLGALPWVIRHAWAGVLLWTWISIMNPHRLTWGFAYDAPFAAIAAGATLLALFTTKDPVRLPRTAVVKTLVAFILWMCVTTVFAMSLHESVLQLSKVMKIQLMTLVALAVLHEKKTIILFVWINALSLGLLGLKGGIFTVVTGGEQRVWGPGGFIAGNNEIGLAILVAIPLMYFLYLNVSQKLIRYGLLIMMVFSAIAVLGTQSRGAFLAIAMMSFVLWWRAPKKLLLGMGLVLCAVLALMIMPWTLQEKISSITEYEQDASAVGRLNAWETALNVANSRPLGAGFDMYNPVTWAIYSPKTTEKRASDPSIIRAAHSIYFQVLGEHGWFGLLLFLLLGWLVWRTAARLRKRATGNAELQWVVHLAGMCQVALVGYAVGGAFLSLAYFDLPYNLLVVVVVTERWLDAWQRDSLPGNSAERTSDVQRAA